MKKNLLLLGAVIVVTGFAGSADAQTIVPVPNGDFNLAATSHTITGNGTQQTATTITDWRQFDLASYNTGSTFAVSVVSVTDPLDTSGTAGHALQEAVSYVPITGQIGFDRVNSAYLVPVTAGDTYTLSFDALSISGVAQLGVSLNYTNSGGGTTGITQPASQPVGVKNITTSWTNYGLSFTVSSGATDLSFGIIPYAGVANANVGLASTFDFTNVTLVDTSVPEPKTTALAAFAIGLLAFAYLRRLKTRSVS